MLVFCLTKHLKSQHPNKTKNRKTKRFAVFVQWHAQWDEVRTFVFSISAEWTERFAA